jgi:hypothetical protein
MRESLLEFIKGFILVAALFLPAILAITITVRIYNEY